MGTKTVGLREEVYERLAAEKREGESFSDVVSRILDDEQSDWRHSFGVMSERAEAFEQAVRKQREGTSHGLADRQGDVIERMRPGEDGAEEGSG
jgi:predicted CopG family antitoxin